MLDSRGRQSTTPKPRDSRRAGNRGIANHTVGEKQAVVLPRGLQRQSAKPSFDPFGAGPLAGTATFTMIVIAGLLLIQIISSALSPGKVELSTCVADSQAYEDSLALAQIEACFEDEAVRLMP